LAEKVGKGWGDFRSEGTKGIEENLEQGVRRKGDLFKKGGNPKKYSSWWAGERVIVYGNCRVWLVLVGLCKPRKSVGAHIRKEGLATCQKDRWWGNVRFGTQF